MKKASKICEYRRLSAIIEANKSHYDSGLIDFDEYVSNFETIINYIDWLLNQFTLFSKRYENIEISVTVLRDIINSLNEILKK